jgi:hypothetical protein
MIRITRISTFTEQGTQRAARAWQTVASQPSWIARIALYTFLIVIGLPIAILFVLALVLAMFVFAVLAGCYWLWTRVRGALPRRDGRENVKVVRRAD